MTAAMSKETERLTRDVLTASDADQFRKRVLDLVRAAHEDGLRDGLAIADRRGDETVDIIAIEIDAVYARIVAGARRIRAESETIDEEAAPRARLDGLATGMELAAKWLRRTMNTLDLDEEDEPTGDPT